MSTGSLRRRGGGGGGLSLSTLCLVLVLVLGATLHLGTEVAEAKPIYAGDTWFKDCENTFETRDNITDDKGFLCSRDKLNYETGCCEGRGNSLHDCSRCKSNECCDTYEHCVSCCLGNRHVEEYMKSPSVYRVALHPETGGYEKKWDYCMGQCRTNPLATISENRYKDPFHFCHSKYPQPENNFLKLPADLKVETAMRGQDCNSACSAKGMRCAPEHFEKINLCEIMSEYTGFRCRFCKMNSKGTGQVLGGPAVQHTPGVNEMFDGNCIQNKDVRTFKCEQSIVETYNRICPCMDQVK